MQISSKTRSWVFIMLSCCILSLISCTVTEAEQQVEATATTKPPLMITPPLGYIESPTLEGVVLFTVTPEPSPATIVIGSPTFTDKAPQLPTVTMMPKPTTVLPPTVTPTITPLPTLSIEDEGDLLSMLMANNGGCNLPCWWGVIPGETTLQEGRDMFVSQGIDYWSVAFDKTYVTMGLGYPIQDGLSHSQDVFTQFELKNDVIQYIQISAGYKHEDSKNIFMQDWSQYKLSTTLSHYGVPSHARLFHVENSPYYHLGISYASLGIEIRYIILPESLENGRVCADMERTDFIYLVLYPPEQASEIPIITPNLDSYKIDSWSSITGLNLEEFYNIFIEDLACVEID